MSNGVSFGDGMWGTKRVPPAALVIRAQPHRHKKCAKGSDFALEVYMGLSEHGDIKMSADKRDIVIKWNVVLGTAVTQLIALGGGWRAGFPHDSSVSAAVVQLYPDSSAMRNSCESQPLEEWQHYWAW
uniref:Uncharacterized protein n=1 Tax=Timema cristinae TaxID=61476 RepID=A0A7R9GT76_TIMCR|nr:unnamed protein product [Timema cristinae]